MEPMVSPSLVVVSGSGRERRIPVPAHGLVLGRDGQLGVPFSTDQFVSRNHVALRRRDDSCVEIADLGSENGTYLNGAQVRDQARMRGGDVLRIGEIELKLDLPPSPAMSFDATIIAGPNDERALVPSLVIVTPDAYSGRRIRLPGQYMVVGRGPTSDICLDDPYISRTHAALRRHGDAVYVQDLGSSAGTFVNGTAVTSARELRPGDLVTFAGVQAGVQARFELAGAGQAAPGRPTRLPPPHRITTLAGSAGRSSTTSGETSTTLMSCTLISSGRTSSARSRRRKPRPGGSSGRVCCPSRPASACSPRVS